MKLRFKIILFCCVLVTALTMIFLYNNDISHEYKRATDYFNISSFYDAEELYMHIIMKHPSSSFATQSVEVLASFLYETKNREKVSELYELTKSKKVEVLPETLILFASNCYFTENFTKILEILNQIDINTLTLNQKQEQMLLYLLSLLNVKGYEQSVEYEENYCANFPDDSVVFFLIGTTLLKQNDFENALEYLTKYCNRVLVYDSISNNDLTRVLVAQAQFVKMQKYELAFTYYERLKVLIPLDSKQYQTVLFGLGTTAYFMGQYQIAEEFLTLVAQNSSDAEMSEISKDYLHETRKVR